GVMAHKVADLADTRGNSYGLINVIPGSDGVSISRGEDRPSIQHRELTAREIDGILRHAGRARFRLGKNGAVGFGKRLATDHATSVIGHLRFKVTDAELSRQPHTSHIINPVLTDALAKGKGFDLLVGGYSVEAIRGGIGVGRAKDRTAI